MLQLKTIREKAGKKQEEIADLIGVERTTYNRYENGNRQCPYDNLFKIADIFHVSIDELLGYKPLDKDSHTSLSHLQNTNEHALIKKYRSLSPDGQERILHQCNLELLAEGYKPAEKESPAS